MQLNTLFFLATLFSISLCAQQKESLLQPAFHSFSEKHKQQITQDQEKFNKAKPYIIAGCAFNTLTSVIACASSQVGCVLTCIGLTAIEITAIECYERITQQPRPTALETKQN